MKNKGFTQLLRAGVGFTLIEIMVVLVIIGILMGLISAAVFKAMESAKISKAEADIATLETALCAYEADIGDYPQHGVPATADNNFKTYLQDSHPLPWNGPYMHFKGEDLSIDGTDFLDPWGNPYWYTWHGGSTGGKYFDIWSIGPDEFNNWGDTREDDITNW